MPFNKISFGPVWHLEEIINFFNVKASNSTFGKPSYLEDRINNSVCFNSGKGFSTKSIIFIIRPKLLFDIYS